MYYLGVDVGSVSTDLVLIDEDSRVIESLYLRTKGKPIQAIQEGLGLLKNNYHSDEIKAVGTTGSGRHIASYLLGADAVKNEITAHAVAVLEIDKAVKAIIEIGGQDSKIIILRDGIVIDFAMNTVCAAGTGSFLDRQAERLEIPIEQFGDYALKAKSPVRIAGRCAVFAESDMIHKQQMGCSEADIIRGLCDALVRNYLNNVAKGKEILPKIYFQGGVAANSGMKAAFEAALQQEVSVPENFKMMGAIGSAILAKKALEKKGLSTAFKGFDVADMLLSASSFECSNCPNQCEVVRISHSDCNLGFFGDRCGRWNNSLHAS